MDFKLTIKGAVISADSKVDELTVASTITPAEFAEIMTTYRDILVPLIAVFKPE